MTSTTLLDGQTVRDPVDCLKGVDLTEIREEIRVCQQDHGRCANQPLPSSLGPEEILLIDTDQACLVSSSTSASYVCLSYVWGNDVWLQTMSENISMLRIPGALSAQEVKGLPSPPPNYESSDSDEDFFGDMYAYSNRRKARARAKMIPSVIRDAMEVVQSLGERYLWVDSLCIVQNDEARKHDQIQGMGSIYSAALLTIIALSGRKASHGLGDHFQRNEQWFHSEDSHGPSFMLCNNASRPEALYDMMMNLKMSYYGERAWTFQEYLLSRRCLFFYNGIARPFFLCRNDQAISSASPSSDLLSLLLNPLSSHAGHTDKIYNGLRKYGHLVQQYTFKSLSRAEDKVNAFAGILQGLLYYYELGDQSWVGLPNGALDFALLWAPMLPVGGNDHFGAPLEQGRFPTWSWASQNGQVEYESVGIEEAEEHCWWSCISEFHYRQSPDLSTSSSRPRNRVIDFSGLSEGRGLNNVLPIPEISASLTNASKGCSTEHNVAIAAHVLEFTAPCVEAAMFCLASPVRGPYRASRFSLTMLNDLQPCGMILADAMHGMDLVEARLQFEAAHFILISQTYRPFLEIEEADQYDVRHRSADGWKEVRKRSVCNVLMVHVSGSYAKRIGIGKIDLRAWETAKAELRIVRLR